MDPTVALIYYGVLTLLLGLCVGSFLNVVIWRLHYSGQMVSYAGQKGKLSLAWPPSHCPNCDAPVRWYQNIPVLSWIFLRARCATCKVPIPIRYPLVELATGSIFLAFYLAYFVGHWQAGFTDPRHDWPAFVLHLFMIASLLAASAIDADWFEIPLGIPWLMAGVALVFGPFINHQVIPHINYSDSVPLMMLARGVIGAFVGLIIANVLLWLNIIKTSFLLPPSAAPDPTDTSQTDAKEAKEAGITPLPSVTNKSPLLLATGALLLLAIGVWFIWPKAMASLMSVVVALVIFLLAILPRDAATVDVTEEVEEEINAPGARKEILREILFVLFPIAGACVAAILPWNLPAEPHVQRLLGIGLGILAGGGIVWFVRIGGTLGFGKQAMGLGDVHLMAGVGAIIGAPLVLGAFFMAPFLGLLWAVSRIILRKSNVVPYGPWLSLASILSLLIAEPIARWYLDHFLRQ